MFFDRKLLLRQNRTGGWNFDIFSRKLLLRKNKTGVGTLIFSVGSYCSEKTRLGLEL